MHIKEVAEQLQISIMTLRYRLDFYELYMQDEVIPDEVVEKWLEERNQYIELDNAIEFINKELLGNEKKLQAIFKTKLKVYAQGCKYWGARVKQHTIWGNHFSNSYVYIKDLDLIKNGLFEAIFFHNSSEEEIVEYLINEIRKKNVNNMEKLSNYIVEYKKKVEKLKNYGELLNYLRFNLDFDLITAENKEISMFMSVTENFISKPALKLLVEFYDYLKENDYISADVRITYNKHQNTEKDTTVLPYDINTYFSIAFMVFNENFWIEQDMINKAIEMQAYAKLWLYHAMLFICAWRSNDIRKKLPRFELKDSPKETLRKIRDFEYSEQEFTVVAEQLFFRFKYQGQSKKPEKIKKNSSAQSLRFTISESVKPVLGMLALMCEAHNEINGEKGSLCEMRAPNNDQCYKLFGKSYKTILNKKAFSARRANKNYMNLVNENAEGIDGYMLAAYARSHTGGFNQLPDVTARYLTAKMDGYTPDEIVKCLFERGICSFIPYLFCSAVYGDEFEKNQIPEQTKRMKDVSLSPARIESLLTIDAAVEKRCKEQIQKIIKWSYSNSMKDFAKELVENIVKGIGLGKEEDVFCLAKICYQRCEYPQRTSCLGCGNEMYAKSMVIGLGQEIYRQEQYLESAKTNAEKIKRNAILDNKLYPAAYEMLFILSEIYHVDIKEYQQILIRGDEYGLIGGS